MAVLPAPDIAAALADAQRVALERRVFRFATPLATDVTTDNSGLWDQLTDGRIRWRVALHSPGAHSLNLAFDRYTMPEGGELTVTEFGAEPTLRAFTAEDNEAHGQLWTPLQKSDRLLVAVTLPAAARSSLDLHLATVNHGFRSWHTGSEKHAKIGGDTSGSCNIDVICTAAQSGIGPAIEQYRNQMRSVGAYTVGGVDACSGAMINNTANDGRPFFLTAWHCDVRTANAPSVVVFWNFQNTTCRVPGSTASGAVGNGSLTQFNTGSIFRAGRNNSDFCLLELDDPVNPTHRVYYSGWDRTGVNTPLAVGIHHPAVAEKRISFELNPTTITSRSSTTTAGEAFFIRVADWDFGTTEGGSSGSPLYNDNGLIIGQLFGGDSACGNNLADWYGRISSSWSTGSTPDARLNSWLDPLGTGVTSLQGGENFPTLKITPAAFSVAEGNTGAAEATFSVSLTPAATRAVTASYQTVAGTATPDVDFTPASGTLTFAAGETSKEVTVNIITDSIAEENETFSLRLTNPVNASAGGPSQCTILNDDFITPVINSSLSVEATVGQTFSYNITALNTPTGFTILDGPETMTVDGDSGAISWVPTSTITATVRILATNPAGTHEVLLTILVKENDFFKALDLSPRQVTESLAKWMPVTVGTQDGIDAVRSAVIGHNQSTWFELEAQGPDIMSFWWRTSSEQDFDFLTFTVNGQQVSRISGENNYTQINHVLPAGRNVVRWTYAKDGSDTGGADAAWVDQLQLASDDPEGMNPPTITSPLTAVTGVSQPFSYTIRARSFITSYGILNPPPGVTVNASTGAVTWTPSSIGTQSLQISATNLAGTTVKTLQVSVLPNAIFEAVDTSIKPVTESPVRWQLTTQSTYDGQDAARSPTLANSASSWFDFTVNGPELVSFWWKVSSQQSSDFLSFSANGTTIASISGENDWRKITHRLNAGSNRLRWTYAKNNTGSAGLDTAWVDEIRLSSENPTAFSAPVVTTPPAFTVVAGTALSYSIRAQENPFSYAIADAPEGMTVNAVTGIINWTSFTEGSWNVRLRATNPIGTGEAVFVVTVLPNPVFQALDIAAKPFFGEGDPWPLVTDTTHDGVDALSTPATVGSSISRISMDIPGPDRMSFWWRKSGTVSDGLSCLVDGQPLGEASSDGEWSQFLIALPGATNRVTFVWAKSSPTEFDQDKRIAGWIDEVRLASVSPELFNLPLITSASSATAEIGRPFTYTIAATGMGGITYSLADMPANMEVNARSGQVTWTPLNDVPQMVRLRATNANGTGEKILTITVLQNSLFAALDITPRQYSESEAPWTIVTEGARDSVDALRAAQVSGSGPHELRVFVNGPDIVSFWWRMSSPDLLGRIEFSVDGRLVALLTGENPWRQVAHTLSTGTHLLSWTLPTMPADQSAPATGFLDQLHFESEQTTFNVYLPTELAAEAGAPFFHALLTPPIPVTLMPSSVLPTGLNLNVTSHHITGVVPPGAFETIIIASNPADFSITSTKIRATQLGAALDTPGQVWRTHENGWDLQTTVTSDGRDAAGHAPIAQGRSAWMETIVYGPASMQWRWRTASAEGGDLLRAMLDGVTTHIISGEIAWRDELLEIPEGKHFLRFQATTGSAGGPGMGGSWVDAVRGIPYPEVLAFTPENGLIDPVISTQVGARHRLALSSDLKNWTYPEPAILGEGIPSGLGRIPSLGGKGFVRIITDEP